MTGFTQRRQLLRQPRREAWVEVNLDALEQNINYLKQVTTLPLMAVLKADAYGHGVALTLPVLEGCGITHVAVSSVDEALEIRALNPEIAILVLGPTPDWALDTAYQHNITLAVADAHQLPLMADYTQKTGHTLTVHIKVDTGMHRVGIALAEAIPFIIECMQNPLINVDGLFSHLANGSDSALTQQQMIQWESVVNAIDAWCADHDHLPPQHRHILNTPGCLSHPVQPLGPYHTLARIGLALWGYPSTDNNLPPLRPVMGLKGRITHLQTLPAQQGVSYGPSYTTQHETRVATLPMGYADGIPRNLSNQLWGLCQGVTIPQIGAITMDQMMWDVTDVPQVALGSVITLLNSRPDTQLTLTPWANQLNTIEYELMCGLRVRLPKIYVRD